MKTRRPQPTVLKVLRGNPGKRQLNQAEPQHERLDGECPSLVADADELAREEWERVAPGLISAGQVTTVDQSTLIGYCVKYAQWVRLEQEARKHPFIVRSPSGYPMPNPAIGLANKVFNLMLKAAAELGITPSSRSRVTAVPPTATVSKWAGLK